MRKRPHTRLTRWILALGLLLAASAASAQPCCECRCPRNEEPACSEDFGLDDDAYLAAVCEPLGCTIAVCTDKACAQASRCPRSEEGRCGDGFDNDADGLFDCGDPDCAEDDACVGVPTPGSTPAVTPGPGATPTPTPVTQATSTPVAGQDCCVGHADTGGCEIAGCQTCVCDLDAFCCEEIWDATCAERANAECLDVCLCALVRTPSHTPSPSPAATATPTPDRVPANDCCAGRGPAGGPGCSLPGCESCVCDVDDFCCTEFWDGSCADIADAECLDDCACDSAPPITPTPTRAAPMTRSPGPPASPTRRGAPCTRSDQCPPDQVCTDARRCGVPSPTPRATPTGPSPTPRSTPTGPSPTPGGNGGAPSPTPGGSRPSPTPGGSGDGSGPDGSGGNGSGGGCTVQPPAGRPRLGGASLLAWLVFPALLCLGRRRQPAVRHDSRAETRRRGAEHPFLRRVR